MSRSHPRRCVPEFALGGLAAATAAATAATALLASRRFFLTDDFATYFMPGFREIARLLGEGRFPLLTDRLWSGGALLQEYQYAVFNTVSVGLYVALGKFDDLALAADIFSLFHIALLAAGVFFLARTLGCGRRYAFLAAVLAPLSDWIFYWGATDWVPALVSLAWLVWAWGFLILTFRRRAFAPAAAATVAMTLVSGWPFADLALLISVALAAEILLAAGARGRIRQAAWVFFALLAGALLAEPAIAPLAIYAEYIHRGSDPSFWSVDVPALLGVGVPYFITHWRFDQTGVQTVYQPMAYVAWFVPIALVNADWRRLRRDPAGMLLLASAGMFAALSMLPSVWQFRFMFRLLPYYQLSVLLLATLALSQADKTRAPWRLAPTALVVAAGTWLALCQAPTMRMFFVGVGGGLAVSAWIGARLLRQASLRWTVFALVTCVAAFELSLWKTVDGHYPQFPTDWTPPLTSQTPGRAAAGPTRYAVFPPFVTDPGLAFWSAFGPDNTSLLRPGASIMGYSPMLSQPFYRPFCQGHFGADCKDVVARVTAPIPPTGLSAIDLMSVDEVVIQQPKDARAFAASAGGRWRVARGAAGEWRFDRLRSIGLVSWTSPGVTAQVRSSSPASITLQARNADRAPGTLVLARAWYPGWSATLNGAPIVARPLAGLLVSVDLPPDSRGQLAVSFWPSGLTVGLILAAFGALLTGLATVFPRLIDGPSAGIEAAFSARTGAAGA